MVRLGAETAGLLTVKGERHMGTNFVQNLLQHYFPSRTRRIPKHGHFYRGCNPRIQPGAREHGYDVHLCCSK